MLKSLLKHDLYPIILPALGCFILIFQLIYNRTFFIDEAALALNIVNKDFYQLTNFLDHNQSAPILFLWLSKLIYLLHPSDFALRIIPTTCSLVSIWLLKGITISYFKELNVTSKLLGLILFYIFFNTVFIRYSTEFKQYSLELLVSCIFMMLATKGDYVRSIVCLIFSIPFAHITPILFATLLLVMVFDWQSVKNKVTVLSSLSIFYVAVLYIYLDQFFFDNPTRNYMLEFWHYSFPTKNLLSLEFILWFFSKNFGNRLHYILLQYFQPRKH